MIGGSLAYNMAGLGKEHKGNMQEGLLIKFRLEMLLKATIWQNMYIQNREIFHFVDINI